MSSPLPYLIYLLGPLVLAVLVRGVLGAGWRPIGAGLITFFLAWIGVMVVTQTAASLSRELAEGTVLYTVVVAVAAGVLEESGRLVAFRVFRTLRGAPTWRTGLAYAVGHSGMESVIVGGSLVLTAAVVSYHPELLSPELLARSEELLGTGLVGASYGAIERVLVGCLIHAAWTLVVVLAVVRSDLRFLALAIGWHAAHDVIAQNLQHLSSAWTVHAAWIGIIGVGYGWALLRLTRAIGESTRGAPAVQTGGGVA